MRYQNAGSKSTRYVAIPIPQMKILKFYQPNVNLKIHNILCFGDGVDSHIN